jgi:hypothetical protein
VLLTALGRRQCPLLGEEFCLLAFRLAAADFQQFFSSLMPVYLQQQQVGSVQTPNPKP